jgi:hypothetical protein
VTAFTPEWAESVSELVTALPPLEAGSGSVALTVSAGRGKEVTVAWSYPPGAPAAPGAEPDLALTISADDAAAVFSGEVEPSVAFMRGRLKASGDGALLLGFLKSTTTPEFAAWLKRVP